MDKDQIWKEQLGFISGTIIAWGTLFLSLWPIVAMLQTGLNIHVWTVVLPGETPKPAFPLFTSLTMPLALGAATIFLSLVHIFARGLWLGVGKRGTTQSANDYVKGFLTRAAHTTYAVVLAQWLIALLMVCLGFIGTLLTGFELVLRSLFSSTSGWLRFIAVLPLLLIFVPLGLILYSRRHRLSIPKILKALEDISELKFRWAAFSVFLAWLITTEMCYTADLSLNNKIVSRSEKEYIVITVRLGGATSDKQKAKLQMRDAIGITIQDLEMFPVGDGEYISYVFPSNLHDEIYSVVLTYPHLFVDANWPYLHPAIERAKSVVVAP